MKRIKLVVPALALIITTIGLFAMTQKESEPVKSTLPEEFFWYEYDPGTNKLGNLLNPSSTVPIEKSEVPTDCQDDELQPECARAYNENNRANQSNPPTPLDIIRKTEPIEE